MKQNLCRNRKLRTNCSKRRGAATVEFALVAPILIIFFFGILELGRVMMAQNVLTNATREGARMATLNEMDVEEIQTLVQEYAEAGSINSVTVTVTPEDFLESAKGTPITVTATVNFNDVSILPAPWFLGDREITSSTVMRKEATVSQ